jgi:hypothetical protein
MLFRAGRSLSYFQQRATPKRGSSRALSGVLRNQTLLINHVLRDSTRSPRMGVATNARKRHRSSAEARRLSHLLF